MSGEPGTRFPVACPREALTAEQPVDPSPAARLADITAGTSSTASRLVIGFRGMPVARAWCVGVLESFNASRSIVGRRGLTRIGQIAWSYYLFRWVIPREQVSRMRNIARIVLERP
jgi:hypothetical protein